MGSSAVKASAGSASEERLLPFIMAIGGGKGGTGKSIVSLNMAHSLAREGLRVVLADLDLGAANLHVLLGMRRCKATLRDFFGGKVANLSDLLVTVADLNIALLPGSDEVAGVVQPGFQRKLKLARHLHSLSADVVVCDLGGNASLDTLDLFNEADWGIVVTTVEPTAVQNSYGFVKAAVLRRLVRLGRSSGLSRELTSRWWSADGEAYSGPGEIIEQLAMEYPEKARELSEALSSIRLSVIVNQAREADATRVFHSLEAVCRRFLGIELDFLGWIPADPSVGKAVVHGTIPRLSHLPPAPLAAERVQAALEPALAVGCNEEVRVGGRVVHVQTEDLGNEVRAYHSLVYSGGRIVLSKRVEYGSPFFERAPSRLKQDRVRFLHRTIVAALQSGRLPLDGDGERTAARRERTDHGLAGNQG